MTNFNTPLSTPQKAKLRSGEYAGDYLLTLCKNTVVFSGQLDTATTGLASWSFINYTSHVGSYTDIEPNMAILFSNTNDIKTAQNNRGRIRFDYVANACATATTVYVSESSQDWGVGTYFWVIYTFDIVPRLSFFNFSVESIDFNQSYQGDPPVAPTLRIVYVGDCDLITGKYRVAFDVSDAYSPVYGVTVTSFAWTFKAGTDTVISGSKSTAIVTIDFEPGEQWGKLTMTDSAGVTWDRRFYIHAHDDDNPYDTGFEKIVVSDNLQQGWTCRAPAFAGVDDVLSKTFGVVTRGIELYGYAEYHLDTNNIAFAGWVQREDTNLTPDPIYSLLSDTTFQLNGVSAMLARMGGQEIGVGSSDPLTPGQWGYNAHPTPWRAIIHYLAYYTTALFLCGFDADTKDETYLYPSIAMTGQNGLDIPTSVAKTINAGLAFAPDGRIRLDKDASHWNTARRATDTPIATFTSSDGEAVGYTNDLAGYGLVDADGLYYNIADGSVNAFKVRAPGTAMGEAQNRGVLSQQILAATSDGSAARNELIQRANDELEALNISEVLTWKFPDGYNFLIASRGQTYAFIIDATIAGPNGINRVIYDGSERFCCESVNESLVGNGAVEIIGTFKRLNRVGDTTGLDMTPGPDTNNDITIPDIQLPAFDWQWPELIWPDDGSGIATIPDPPTGRIAWFNGTELVVHTATKAYFLRNVSGPGNKVKAIDITPLDLGSYQIKAVAVDPFFTSTAVPIYLLASDGANSAVWYTENGAIAAPTWVKGADYSGIYTGLRATNTDGGILIFSPDNSLPSSDCTPTDIFGHSTIQQLTSHIWRITTTGTVPDINNRYGVELTTTGDDCGCEYWGIFNMTGFTPPNGDGTNQGGPWDCFGVFLERFPDGLASGNGWQLYYYSQNYDAQELGIIDVRSLTSFSFDFSFTSSGGALPVVRYSDDYGATFGDEIPVGLAINGGNAGFDTQRSGTNSFASGDGVVFRADTLGGNYASYYSITGGAQAACIIIPYFNWAGVKQTDATHPDIIVALNQLDGSNRSLLWIEGGATPSTVHDLTPVAGMIFDRANCVTSSYNHHLACFGNDGGTRKLYRTVNKGTTWTLVKTVTSAEFIRCRRNDNRGAVSGSNKGQLYLADSNLWFSSDWAYTGPYVRTMPTIPILGLDTVY